MTDTPVNSRLGEEIARWVSLAIEHAAERDWSEAELIAKSTIAKSTFYRMKKGGGGEQGSLDNLARALGVRPPIIGKALISDLKPVTATELLAEAVGILERVQEAVRPPAASKIDAAALQAGELLGQKPDAPKPKSRRRKGS